MAATPGVVAGFRHQDLCDVLHFLQDNVDDWHRNTRAYPQEQRVALLGYLQALPAPIFAYDALGVRGDELTAATLREQLQAVVAAYRKPGRGCKSGRKDVYDLFSVDVEATLEERLLASIGWESGTGAEKLVGDQEEDVGTKPIVNDPQVSAQKRKSAPAEAPTSSSPERVLFDSNDSPAFSPLTERGEDEDTERQPKRLKYGGRDQGLDVTEKHADTSVHSACSNRSQTATGNVEESSEEAVACQEALSAVQNKVQGTDARMAHPLFQGHINPTPPPPSKPKVSPHQEATVHPGELPARRRDVSNKIATQQLTRLEDQHSDQDRGQHVVIPRTGQRSSAYELRLDQGDDAVQKAMRLIFGDVMLAAEHYMRSHNVEAAATARIEYNPEPELEVLYVTLLGSDWKGGFWELQDTDEPYYLSTREMLTALIGASVHKDVLSASLPWDLQSRLRTTFSGPELEALKVAHRATGCDHDIIMKHWSLQQSRQPLFEEEAVATYAQELAKNLKLKLQAHLRKMQVQTNAGKSTQQLPWTQHMVSAFKKALLLRHRLNVSDTASYRSVWFAGGQAFDVKKHRSEEYKGVQSKLRVVMTLLPGIEATDEEGPEFFAEARVLTQQVEVQS